MSVTTEELRILQTVKGDDALVDLQQKLANVGKEEQNLIQLSKLAVDSDQLVASEARRLAAEKVKLTEKIGLLERGLDASTSKMKGFGQSAMQTGRVAQDFAQGGIGGIINNIEGLSLSLGGGAGLAGVLTIVGVGFLVFKDRIRDTAREMGILGDGADKAKGEIGRLETRIKELEAKGPTRLAIDSLELENAEERLEKLKKGLAAFKAAQEGKDQFQKESGSRVAGILAEESPGGEGAIAESLKRSREQQLKSRSKELEDSQKEIEFYQKKVELEQSLADSNADTIAVYQAFIKTAEERAAKARLAAKKDAEAQIGQELAGAKEGDTAKQFALAKSLRRIGQGDLAESIEGNTPERVKADEEEESAWDRRMERLKARGEKEREQERRRLERERNINADRDKEIAEAVAQTDRESDDLKATAKDDLIGGAGKDTVKAKMKAAIRAELDRANEIRQEIRDAVAEAVSEKYLSGIGTKEVEKARASGDTKAERDRKAAETKAKQQAKAIADPITKNTDVDEQARALVNQVRTQGGAPDDQGQFRRMNPAQQQRYIQGEIFKDLRRRGIGAQQAQIATGPIMAQAYGQDDIAALRMATPMARPRAPQRQARRPKPAPRPAAPAPVAPVLAAVDDTHKAVAQTQNAVAQQAQDIRRLRAQANQLQRNAQKLQQPTNTSQNMSTP